MDSAVDVAAIKQHSQSDFNRVPIININPRAAVPGLKQELADEGRRLQPGVGHRMAEQVRYGERCAAEQVNGGLEG